jgi:hypothetical protein
LPQDPTNLAPEQERSRLRAVMAYLCQQYPAKDELSNARLTKLVYLADWQAARHFGHQLTGVRWMFNHYGPWVPDVVSLAQTDPLFGLFEERNAFGSPKIRIGLSEPLEDGSIELDGAERAVLDRVIEETRKLYFGQFIDYVYDTYPVKASARYSTFNLSELAERSIAAEGRPEPLAQPVYGPSPLALSEETSQSVTKQIEAYLMESLGAALPEGLSQQVEQWIENPTLEWVDTVTIDAAKQSDDELTLDVTAELTVDGFTTVADYYERTPPSVEVRDSDWSENYMWVAMQVTATMQFRASGVDTDAPLIELTEAALLEPSPISE